MNGLAARGVVVRFGGLVALDDVAVEAVPGRITGLIGPNGAGKTTLFNVCCGFQRLDAGSVLLDGVDVTHKTPARRARSGIGRTFQRMELFGSLTVRQNIAFAAESVHVTDDPFSQLGLRRAGTQRRSQRDEFTEAILERVGLLPVAERMASEISTGQGRLVELARALARRPRILLLDEPSSGLDAVESNAFGELLVGVVSEFRLGVLMIEHDMSLVLNICDWVHVLDFGRMLMSGTPAEVRRSDEVRQAYLGKSAAA